MFLSLSCMKCRSYTRKLSSSSVNIAADSSSHHVSSDGIPLYKDRFEKVLSFHKPENLAAVRDKFNQAFHIDRKGFPAYEKKFMKSFGFYWGLAAVEDSTGYYHIKSDGSAAYPARWNWCGNFSSIPNSLEGQYEYRSPVLSGNRYFHINDNGIITGGPFSYCGDFTSHGHAKVWKIAGDPDIVDVHGLSLFGQELKIERNVLDIMPPHKDISAIKDSSGWFFVDRFGKEFGNGRRYRNVEPHYNGRALVTLLSGQQAVVDESGDVLIYLAESESQMITEISDEATRYFKPFALKMALDLGLLNQLQSNDVNHVHRSRPTFEFEHYFDEFGFDKAILSGQVLGVCEEMGLCHQTTRGIYSLTQRGECLVRNDVNDRCNYWLRDRYLKAWLPSLFNETKSASSGRTMKTKANRDVFAEVGKDSAELSLSQRVLQQYADEDWKGIGPLLPLQANQTVVDLGGGKGSLLRELSDWFPLSETLDLICFDRHEVVALVEQESQNIVKFVGGDLFSGPLPSAHLYLLSRVLHDWPDDMASVILNRLHTAAAASSQTKVVVIDRVVTEQRKHATISLHMYLLQRAQERSADQWNELFSRSGWDIASSTSFREYAVMTLVRKDSNKCGGIAENGILQELFVEKVASSQPVVERKGDTSLSKKPVVKKAVVPIAGIASRMFPQSLVLPKALLPFVIPSVDSPVVTEVRPALLLLLDQLLHPEIGITNVFLVTSSVYRLQLQRLLSSLHLTENGLRCKYLDVNQSHDHNQDAFLDGKISLLMQEEARGLGHAVLQARNVIGGEPFILALGDHVFSDGCVRELLHAYASSDISRVGTALTGATFCSEAEIAATGLLHLGHQHKECLDSIPYGHVIQVADMEEKPIVYDKFEWGINSTKYLSQLGIDILPPEIFEILENECDMYHKGDVVGKEVGIRDAMKELQRQGNLFTTIVTGRRHDFGTPQSYSQSFRNMCTHGIGSYSTDTSEMTYQTKLKDIVKTLFEAKLPLSISSVLFDRRSSVFAASAPGRLDLMGGVADYSGSHVLEYGLSQRTFALVAMTGTGQIDICSLHADENAQNLPWHRTFDRNVLYDDDHSKLVDEALLCSRLAALATSSGHVSEPPNFTSYVVGAVHAACKLHVENGNAMLPLPGLAVVLVSNVAIGAGLASSAAIEMSVVQATMDALNGKTTALQSDPTRLALACQFVENNVVGVPSGFMDQFTLAHLKSNELLSFRCNLPVTDVTSTALHKDLEVIGLVSGVGRSLAAGSYEVVRTATEMGCVILKEVAMKDGVHFEQLCDLTPAVFSRYRNEIPVSMRSTYPVRGERKCMERSQVYPLLAAVQYPIEENFRVKVFRDVLDNLTQRDLHDISFRASLTNLAELMAQSHMGYTTLGLGCEHTDLLVRLVNEESVMTNVKNPFIGSRITAGGCGGTVVVLARREVPGSKYDIDGALTRVCHRYQSMTGMQCGIVRGSSGALQSHGMIHPSHFNRRFMSSIIKNNKPRVLIVNHGYPPQFNGGSEVYSQLLASGLLRSGQCDRVDVFAREHNNFKPDYQLKHCTDPQDTNIKLHLMNYPREMPYHRFASKRVDELFQGLLHELRPDIVHFQHLNHLSTGLPAIAREMGAKVVYTLHDFWLMCPRGQFIITGITAPSQEPWALCSGQNDRKCAESCYSNRYATGLINEDEDDVDSTADISDNELKYWTSWVSLRMQSIRKACDAIDAFVAPSVHLQERFLKEFKLPEEKTLLLPYGFDRERLSGRSRLSRNSDDKVVFGYIGRHQPAKGIHILVAAMINLGKTEPQLTERMKLIIFGRTDTATTSSLKDMIQSSMLSPFAGVDTDIDAVIEWRGEYANKDIVSTVFDEVDAIVVPSIWDENSPLVIHEAQQCKVPVITSQYGGMAELVRDGVNGLTFKHRDVQSLADVIKRAVENPDMLMLLGQKGYLHSTDGNVPTMTGHLDHVVRLYHRLLAGEPAIVTNEVDPEFVGLQQLSVPEPPKAIFGIPEPIIPMTAPYRITFDTNPDDCNFTCIMCEQHSEHSPHKAQRKAMNQRRRRMNFDLVKKTVEETVPLGLKEIIPTTMGEPLQYKNFPLFIDLCKEHNIKLNLTTNGSFIGRGAAAWARDIIPVGSDVKISWNGATEETQQKIMKGSKLSKQVENLKTFIAVRDDIAQRGGNYCTVTLQLTFMEVNLNEIVDIVQLAISYGCDRVKGHHLWAHFDEISDQDLRRSADSIRRWNEVARQCREVAASNPLPSGKKPRLDNFIDLPVEVDNASAMDSSSKAVQLFYLDV